MFYTTNITTVLHYKSFDAEFYYQATGRQLCYYYIQLCICTKPSCRM